MLLTISTTHFPIYMIDTIKQKLIEIEQLHDIKILYACESGSRAWGFPSPDSDFDVRFIYTRGAKQYLSIVEIPDTVGLPVNEILDIDGWDLKKALKLFLKSNGPLYEWLQSPIVYNQNSGFLNELQHLMPKYFSLRAGGNHYLSMAYNTLRDDLQAEKVKLKRYFYALRPALACLWIIEKQTLPPMQFKELLILVEDDLVLQSIDDLLKRKQIANEKELIAKEEVLNEWLDKILLYCREQIPLLPSLINETNELDNVFRKYIGDYI